MKALLCPKCRQKTAICCCEKITNSDFSGYQFEYILLCAYCDNRQTSKYNFSLRENKFRPFPRCPWCHKLPQEHVIMHNHKGNGLLAHF